MVNAPRAIDRSRERALCQHIPFRARSPSSSTMGVCILTGKTTTGTVAARDIIKLTETREIPPYLWVHPDYDR